MTHYWQDLLFHYYSNIEDNIQDKATNRLQVRDSKIEVLPKPEIKNNRINQTNLFSPIEAQELAQDLVNNIATLAELKQAVFDFEGCSFKKLANNTVFADGNPEADLIIIGEAPGEQEDLQGIPFCGKSGQLLDKILHSISFSRKNNVYITNTIFWRPPGNRKPTEQELAMCYPFVEKHIALIKPKYMLLLGNSAIQSVLDRRYTISKIRGKIIPYSNKYLDYEIKVLATFHPSYLLRSPVKKKMVWYDMLLLKQKIEQDRVDTA